MFDLASLVTLDLLKYRCHSYKPMMLVVFKSQSQSFDISPNANVQIIHFFDLSIGLAPHLTSDLTDSMILLLIQIALSGLLGDSPEDIALVEEWLSVYSTHLSSSSPPAAHVLTRLDAHLSSTVFFVGSRLTAADCVLYAALHSTVVCIIPSNPYMHAYLLLE
jgi:hypothetical protein